MSIFIIIIIIVSLIYFYSRQNKEKIEINNKKAVHLDKKYKTEIKIHSYYKDRIENLCKLVSDLILLSLVKRLMELDPVKFEKLGKTIDSSTDPYELWIQESNDPQIKNFAKARDLHRSLMTRLDELVNLQQSYIPTYIEQSEGTKIQLDLDIVTNVLINTEDFYKIVNVKKYISKDRISVKNFERECVKVAEKIEEAITEINDRYYEIR